MFFIQTYTIHDYLQVPQLNGTESIHQINGTTTIANNEMYGGSGYLSNSFDNTGNWEASFKLKQTGTRCGALIIKSDETSRDNNEIMVRLYGSYVYVNGSSSTITGYPEVYNTWYDVKLVKNGTSISLTIGNVTKTFTWSLATSLSSLCVGVDSWGDTATIKDIVVKPL